MTEMVAVWKDLTGAVTKIFQFTGILMGHMSLSLLYISLKGTGKLTMD